MDTEEEHSKYKWKLHVDGASNTHGSEAGIVISMPEEDKIKCALMFDFKATNNQAKYEAFMAGLRVATALGADAIDVYNDSQLIVNQVSGEYEAKEKAMIAYLSKTRRALFKSFRIT